MRDRVNTNDFSLGSHGVDDDPVDTVSKRFIHTAPVVEEHIQDLRYCLVWILGLDDVITALHEISTGILLRADQHTVDFGIIIRLVSADGFVLINQKEAPGQRFSGTDILDQPDIVLAHGFTLVIILTFQFFADHSHMDCDSLSECWFVY